jgi:hypothetical protein
MAIARQRLTLEQFLHLPEDEPALEYWRGEVTQTVSPKGPHGAVQLELGRRINNASIPGRLARAFTETRITLAGESTVPDLVVYRWDRIPRDAGGDIAVDFTVAPDVAVRSTRPVRLDARCSNAAAGMLTMAWPWRSLPTPADGPRACSASAPNRATCAASTRSTSATCYPASP